MAKVPPKKPAAAAKAKAAKPKKAPPLEAEVSRHPIAGETYAQHMARLFESGDQDAIAGLLTRIALEADPRKPGYSPAATGPMMEAASQYLSGLSPPERAALLDSLMRGVHLTDDQIARMPMSQKVGILPESMQSAFVPDIEMVPGTKPDMEGSLLADPPAPRAKGGKKDKRSPEIQAAAREGLKGLKEEPVSRVLEGVDEKGRAIRGGVTPRRVAQGQAFDLEESPPKVRLAKDVEFNRAGVTSKQGENVVEVNAPGEKWTQRDIDRGFRRTAGRDGITIEVLAERRKELLEGTPRQPLAMPAKPQTVTVNRGQGKTAEVLLDPEKPASGVRMVPDERAALSEAQIEAQAQQALKDFLGGQSAQRALDAEAQAYVDATDSRTERGVTPYTADELTMEAMAPEGAITSSKDVPRVFRPATIGGTAFARGMRDDLRGAAKGESRDLTGMTERQIRNARTKQLIALTRAQLRGGDAGIFDQQDAFLRAAYAAATDPERPDPAAIALIARVRSDVGMPDAGIEKLLAKMPKAYRLSPQFPPYMPSIPYGSKTSVSIPGVEGLTSGGIWARPGTSSKSGLVDNREAVLRHVIKAADPAAADVLGYVPDLQQGGGLNLDRVLGGRHRATFMLPDPAGAFYEAGRPTGETLANWAVSSLAGERGLPEGVAGRWATAFEDAIQRTLTRPPPRGYLEQATDWSGRTVMPTSTRNIRLLRRLAEQAQVGGALADLGPLVGAGNARTAEAMSAADLLGRMFVDDDVYQNRWRPTTKTQVRVQGTKGQSGGGYEVMPQTTKYDPNDYEVSAEPAAQPAAAPAKGGGKSGAGYEVLPSETPFDPKDYEPAYPPDDEFVYANPAMNPAMNREMLQRALMSGLLA